MPGKLNPTVLLQLMMQYSEDEPAGKARTFLFQKNNRMRVHRETEEEVRRRKSRLEPGTRRDVMRHCRILLETSLKGKLDTVWIDPDMRRIAVPLQTATGNSGYGVLPTGSRMRIPEGKFVRAFTYWEKEHDIDLSVFALDEDGQQEEFSWRNMYGKQGDAITYSGDQTSGYNGGSEYFDIAPDLFAKQHPGWRYLVFCDNVYSGRPFSNCECRAGFMIRQENPKDVPVWKGERNERRVGMDVPFGGSIREIAETRQELEAAYVKIFDPRTVQTSYRITADSTFAYLFAIDLQTREMVWLNMARAGSTRVAGTTGMDVLLKQLRVTEIFNLYDLCAMAGIVVKNPADAKLLVTDRTEVFLNPGQEFLHSWDFEKMLKLIQQ